MKYLLAVLLGFVSAIVVELKVLPKLELGSCYEVISGNNKGDVWQFKGKVSSKKFGDKPWEFKTVYGAWGIPTFMQFLSQISGESREIKCPEQEHQ